MCHFVLNNGGINKYLNIVTINIVLYNCVLLFFVMEFGKRCDAVASLLDFTLSTPQYYPETVLRIERLYIVYMRRGIV